MSATARARHGAAIAAGVGAALVAAVRIARAIRPALLADPEPSWAAARLLLGLALVASVAAFGALAAALVFAAGGERPGAELAPLSFSSRSRAALAAAALLLGVAARLASVSRLPPALWVDDLSLLPAALALGGRPSDFAHVLYAAPLGVPRPFGTVGVAYLEVWHALLKVAGTTVFGVRLPSVLAGVASLGTATLVARAFLPPGGAALTALALAGLRWHLVLSRWGWVALAVAPVADLATLLLLRARRRGRLVAAAAAGLAAGLCAHVYLAAWIAGGALLVFAAWPVPGERGAAALRRAAIFAAGFGAAALPLLLAPRRPGAPAYFARAADHNVRLEMRRARSAMPLAEAAADAALAPYLPDPTPRHDLPGRSRLGWILGVPVAAIGIRALLVPRDELSGWLIAHGGAAFAAAVAAGEATLPNGFRYAYLTTVTAVAAAAGVLWLLGAVRRRRAASLGAVGLLALSAALGARDALGVWTESRAAFDGFHGEDTLLGRAAARWDAYGALEVSPDVGFDPRTHSPITIGVVRRYGLDPDRGGGPAAASPRGRRFRLVVPSEAPRPGERRVERVRDGWGREYGVVFGRRSG